MKQIPTFGISRTSNIFNEQKKEWTKKICKIGWQATSIKRVEPEDRYRFIYTCILHIFIYGLNH